MYSKQYRLTAREFVRWLSTVRCADLWRGLVGAIPGCLSMDGQSPPTKGDRTSIPTYKYDQACTGALDTQPPGVNFRITWTVEPTVENAIMMSWPVIKDGALYVGVGRREGYHGTRRC